jgi:anti-sigma factor RsiW
MLNPPSALGLDALLRKCLRLRAKAARLSSQAKVLAGRIKELKMETAPDQMAGMSEGE